MRNQKRHRHNTQFSSTWTSSGLLLKPHHAIQTRRQSLIGQLMASAILSRRSVTYSILSRGARADVKIYQIFHPGTCFCLGLLDTRCFAAASCCCSQCCCCCESRLLATAGYCFLWPLLPIVSCRRLIVAAFVKKRASCCLLQLPLPLSLSKLHPRGMYYL